MKLNKTFLFSVIIFIVPLIFLFSYRFLGFDGLYGMDSFEYFRFSKELKESILIGQKPGVFFWPQGYPILVGILSFIFPTSLSGQIISCLSLSGIALFAYKTIKITYKNIKHLEWFVFLSLAISPYFIRNGVQFMADISSVFFFIACIYYAIKYSKIQSLRSLFFCGLFAAYGVFVRYGIAIPLIPVFIFIIITWFKNRQLKHILAVIPVFGIFIIHYWLKLDSADITSHHFLDEWSFSNFFKTEFLSDQKHNLASFTYQFPNLAYYTFKLFHPGFFILNGLLLFVWIFKKKQENQLFNVLFVSIIALNTFFLSGVTFQGDRYLFPSYPILLLLLFPAFVFIVDKLNRFKYVFFISLAVLQIALSFRTISPSYERNKLEHDIADKLLNFQNRSLYVFEMDLALQQRDLEFEYKNLWFTEFNSFEKGSLILFNEEKFTPRYTGKPPMNNWNKLNSENKLKEILIFDKGWKLYEIE